jgi:hypothetical protein
MLSLYTKLCISWNSYGSCPLTGTFYKGRALSIFSSIFICISQRDVTHKDKTFLTSKILNDIKAENFMTERTECLKRAVRKVSSHFEYLENRLRGLVVTWQSVRGELTVHP